MSLPLPWIDKIFLKLSLVYGRDFTGRWEGLNEALVKDDWAHELSRFQQNPDAISYALQNLPVGKPPTVIEFRAICNRRPDVPVVVLPSVPADPQRVASEITKLRETDRKADPKDWARRILARHQQGEKLAGISVRFAREALRAEA